jgi:Gas vesicle synthesis protein GvpL/GvpF
VDAGQEEGMGRSVDDLAGQWDGRVELRVLGPLAAYDFAAVLLSPEA